MDESFKNKVIVITGASSGIGAGLAQHFASTGCRGLTLCARSLEDLEVTAKHCTTAGLDRDHILLVRGDVTKQETSEEIVSRTIATFERIDVLVNNAGVGNDSGIVDVDMKMYDLNFDCHCRSAVMLTHSATPHLIKTKGNIVNVSSISSLLPMKGELFYAMSKAALDAFTKCTASELGAFGVRVNSVNPGVTKTNFHARVGFTEQKMEKYLQYEDAATPLGRHGVVDDVVPVIVFLASDSARFVTGTCLPVDGGRTCRISKYEEKK